jgi:hypothetical protein
MNFMKKLVFLPLLALLLTGCADTLPEPGSDEYKQVVEYATSLLLKYDKDYESGLVKISLPEATEESTEGADAETPDGTDTLDTPDTPDNPADPDTATTAQAQDLTELVGVSGLEFRYAGVLVTPKSDDIWYVSVGDHVDDAEDLLYVNFEVQNTSGAAINLNMKSLRLQIRIGYNGGNPVNALSTALLNDLQWFEGDIAAGDQVMLQSLIEVTISDASAVESVEFYVSDANGEHKFVY